MNENEIVARYVKPGEFFSGIPAKDLTRAEFDALDADQKRSVTESGVYVIVAADLKPAPHTLPAMGFDDAASREDVKP